MGLVEVARTTTAVKEPGQAEGMAVDLEEDHRCSAAAAAAAGVVPHTRLAVGEAHMGLDAEVGDRMG